jgi:hypothetical protein
MTSSKQDMGDCRSGTVATREPSRVSPSRPVGRVSTIACKGCGVPLSIPLELLETEEGWHCAGCYFVGPPK